MADAVLATARLDLCVPRPGDVAAHQDAFNTPVTMAHLGGVLSTDAIAAKHEKARALFASDGFGFMLGWERSSGRLAVHCGLKRVDSPAAPNKGDHEIGWIVSESFWRQGFALEAARAVIEWAFDVHCAPHLVALTNEANIASWKLMEKLGMTRAAELDFVDTAFAGNDAATIQYRLIPQTYQAKFCETRP